VGRGTGTAPCAPHKVACIRKPIFAHSYISCNVDGETPFTFISEELDPDLGINPQSLQRENGFDARGVILFSAVLRPYSARRDRITSSNAPFGSTWPILLRC